MTDTEHQQAATIDRLLKRLELARAERQHLEFEISHERERVQVLELELSKARLALVAARS